MPARDRYHYQCRNALVKDGWTITDDPLRVKWGTRDAYVDIGAEKDFLIAEKEKQRIAVEIKSFTNDSEVRDLQNTVGQYFLYRALIDKTEPDRVLHLAVDEEVFDETFNDPTGLGRLLLETYRIPLMVFNPLSETVSRWIP